MSNLRSVSIVAATLLVLSCSGAEQQVVSSFLTAVQSGDEKVAQAVSIAEFSGGVESWEILEVGPAATEPFALSELQAELTKLIRERRLVQEKNAYFRQDNRSAFDEYTAQREKDPEYEFTGELTDFQKEWEERVGNEEELDMVAMELNKKIERLRLAANLSVNVRVNEDFEGHFYGRELMLKVNDGSTEKTFTFTLQKFSLEDNKRNLSPIGRWVITDIKEG